MKEACLHHFYYMICFSHSKHENLFELWKRDFFWKIHFKRECTFVWQMSIKQNWKKLKTASTRVSKQGNKCINKASFKVQFLEDANCDNYFHIKIDLRKMYSSQKDMHNSEWRVDVNWPFLNFSEEQRH